ncbi:hypothetical protein BC826DRAFT_1190263 [Russula brevipes]|nr:hypothetical protein BC826DRAFT_1190263 [Russula brevipes]
MMMVEKHLSIDILSDDVLLHIFSLPASRPGTPGDYDSWRVVWRWLRLVHVCRRWRCLIFAWSRHLGLRLVIGYEVRRRLPKALDSWPAFPISIRYTDQYPLTSHDNNDIAAALEYSDRICEIALTVTFKTIEKSMALTEKPFPVLERIYLVSPYDKHFTYLTAIPSGILGRCPDTLRHVVLGGVSFPTLPRFLLCSHGLVSLELRSDIDIGGNPLSPGDLIAVLSVTTQLKDLKLCFKHDMSHPEQDSAAHSPAPDLISLPSLTRFDYTGPVKYLEDLVSRIHTPLPKQLCVKFYPILDITLDVPQLSQFISRTASLSSPPRRTHIEFWGTSFTIKYYFRDTLHLQEDPCLTSICQRPSGWEMSEVVYVCRQLSPLVSSVPQLTIEANNLSPSPERRSDTAQWVELLAPFDGVQELEVCGSDELCREIVHALGRSTLEMAEEVLPALSVLRARDYVIQTLAARSIESFAAARELSGRPLTIAAHR